MIQTDDYSCEQIIWIICTQVSRPCKREGGVRINKRFNTLFIQYKYGTFWGGQCVLSESKINRNIKTLKWEVNCTKHEHLGYFLWIQFILDNCTQMFIVPCRVYLGVKITEKVAYMEISILKKLSIISVFLWSVWRREVRIEYHVMCWIIHGQPYMRYNKWP